MSVRMLSAVLERSRAKAGALLVLISLADWADDDGWCFPSVKRLAWKARLTERATQYAISDLVEIGELEVIPNRGRNGTNLYRVKPPTTPLPRTRTGRGKGGAKFAPGAVDCTQSVSIELRPTTTAKPP